MPTEIGIREVQQLVEAGAQVVEVLPKREYDEEHLPGATSIPLKSLTWERASELDPARALIVYCWDDD